MKTHAQKLASNALIVGTFALAVVCTALALQGDARSDSVVAAPSMIDTPELNTSKPCAECYERPPFNPGFELPRDMKAAEPIATF
jgi:hypothetical protein